MSADESTGPSRPAIPCSSFAHDVASCPGTLDQAEFNRLKSLLPAKLASSDQSRCEALADEPYFLEEWVDELIQALTSFAAGDGASLVALLRDSSMREEFRRIVLSMPSPTPAWQVPHVAPPEPVRHMGEVHQIVRALEAREAAVAAFEELKAD